MAWDPVAAFTDNVTLSNGDRTLVEDLGAGNPHTAHGDLFNAGGASDGLVVVQFIVDNPVGYVEVGLRDAVGNMAFSWATFAAPNDADSGIYSYPSGPSYVGSEYELTAGDVVTMALNAAGRRLWIRRNADAWIGGGDPELDTDPTIDIAGDVTPQSWPIAPFYYSADDGVNIQGATISDTGIDIDTNGQVVGFTAWDGTAFGAGADPTTLEIPITQTVYLYSETTTIPIVQSVAAPESLSIPIVQSVYAPATVVTADALKWRPIVRINGVIQNVIDAVRVEQEARASRIAEFSIYADGIDPRSLIDLPVTVDYAVLNDDFSVAYSIRRFTGWIIRPTYNPNNGSMRVYCSNKMQQRIERMTRAQIDAITTGALWHDRVFNAEGQGYQYFTDRLSTIPADVDCDAYNRFLLANWTAKLTADLSYGGSLVLDGSVQIFTEDRSTVVNRIRLTHEVRRERSIIRRLNVGWNYPRTFCQYSALPSTLPTRDMVSSVLYGTGWLVSSCSFIPLWETDVYTCDAEPVNFVNYQPQLIRGFSANIQRRWTQTITETFNIVIESKAAQANPVEASESFGISFDFDSEAFEGINGDNRTAPLSSFGGGLSLPDGSLAPERFPVPDGYELSARGDYYFDNIDRDEWADALICKIEQLRCRILGGARKGGIEFKIPLDPRVECSMTAEITAPVTAKGKIIQWVEEMDAIGTAGPTTTIRIALSDGDLSAIVETPRAAPRPIGYDPDPSDEPGGLGSAWDETHLGGLVASDPQDPDWTGYVGNYQPFEAGGVVYEEQFRLDITAIETDLRDNVDLSRDVKYLIAVPHDALTL